MGSCREDAIYSEVSVLYGLELRQLNSRGTELQLVTFIFRVEDEIGLGGTRRRAHVECCCQRIPVSLHLNQELLQPLPIDVALSDSHGAVSQGAQLRSMHRYIYRQIS